MIKKTAEYVVLFESKYSLLDLIHPSHAFILSLCTGRISLEQIQYLVGETYQISMDESKELVNKQLKRSECFIDTFKNIYYNSTHF